MELLPPYIACLARFLFLVSHFLEPVLLQLFPYLVILITCVKTSYLLFLEIICTKHAYVQDPPDLTLFNFMQDTESIPLVIFCGKIDCTHM